MRLSELTTAAALGRRLKRGWPLLGVGGAWAILCLLLPMPFDLGVAIFPLLLLLGTLLLAPSAWQWTGDSLPLAPGGRGLLQSLIWNTLWMVVLLRSIALGSQAMGLPPPAGLRQAQPPPPMEAPPPPLFRPHPPPPRPRPPPRGLEWVHLGLGLLFATVVGRSLAEREASDLREAELQEETQRAQALALQSQMQPHALFNALSGLVELAQEDPEATEEALVGLCSYLRRLMRHTRAESAPLRDERELLQDYLRIEQIRLGDRLRVDWEWPEWADALRVPPLLFQPLVENAILHGIAATTQGGGLRIAVRRAGAMLELEVGNTGQPPQSGEDGMGLGHLRRRLRLWDRDATLTLVREGSWTRATLHLPESSC